MREGRYSVRKARTTRAGMSSIPETKSVKYLTSSVMSGPQMLDHFRPCRHMGSLRALVAAAKI